MNITLKQTKPEGNTVFYLEDGVPGVTMTRLKGNILEQARQMLHLK